MAKINKTYKAGDDFTPDSVNEIITAVNENADGISNVKKTVRSNIAVNVTPVALSPYCAWDTQHAYGYKATITVNGLTANSLIQNLVMSDTLMQSVAYVVTTGENSLTFYAKDATALSGTIITLVTSEVENG